MTKRLNPGAATARGSPAWTSFKDAAGFGGKMATNGFMQPSVFFGDGTCKKKLTI